eukprot:COSAG01_NODE_4583_length_4900_cov_9.820662_1_plen_177_part_10
MSSTQAKAKAKAKPSESEPSESEPEPEPEADAVAEAEWTYLDDAGVEQGPFSESQLRGWCRSGQLTEDRKLRRVGYTGEFIPLSSTTDTELQPLLTLLAQERQQQARLAQQQAEARLAQQQAEARHIQCREARLAQQEWQRLPRAQQQAEARLAQQQAEAEKALWRDVEPDAEPDVE